MAIIAYRQPISKADIESVRGVSVAHIIKALMEMQLVRIVGRSELPGRPFLYGTTHMFLEHFGLKNLKDLDRMAPTVLSRQELKKADAAARVPAEGERLPDEDTMELPFDSPPEAAGSDDAEPEQDSEPEVSEASDAGSEEADTEREDG
jgi:segregation and condensation protein B